MDNNHDSKDIDSVNTATTTEMEGRVLIETRNIEIDKLVPFSNHPFKLYEGQRLADMVESIKANGVLLPIIVRPVDDNNKYEILSGHNRVEAAREVGFESVPAIIRENLTNEEALLIVTETNLMQRSFADLSHSERAAALKTLYDAMKKKRGYRSDLIKEIDEINTSSQTGRKLETREKLGLKYGLDKNVISRYLAANKLIPELKDRLDSGRLGMLAAYSLSCLPPKEQRMLEGLLEESHRVTTKQAEELREKSKNEELDKESINQILERKDPTKTRPVKINSDILSRHFNESQSPEEIEEVILKALEKYFDNPNDTPTYDD